ncbi:hypothetical protein [Brevibacillus laterosporus]|uniref:Uncharacterized protein n=1 Tax=Brevibacillus laterosporus TaxID=1465 RepID=A0AAP3DL00_BRELA|nr:hypothetical protein [Brevibacillus laterosporus]MCR8983105.1 hypothetical protein [Brevibacillus laterosporus]MCZ0810261.1 hypothetical protein [Brevibacillus laterosporus]MCZ0828859.1 hypothetical protein [Brevibacillus laterosporus]MCZ0852896.1 hypothetical protein [Brevibacillus laterosporus]
MSYMRSYLSGAGLSLFFANLIFFIFSLSHTIDFSDLRKSGFDAVILFISLFNYLCCIFGWLLLTILQKSRIKSWLICTFFFIILGSIFGAVLYTLYPEAIILPFITIFGSIMFFVAQFKNIKLISTLLSLSGPIFTILLLIIV